jgi:putative ABC transport system permease protein
MNYIHVLIPFLLVVACAFLSWRIISATRAVVQLTVLGFALTWIFAHNSLIICLVIAAFMTMSSAIHSRSRVKSRYKGLLLDNLFATILSIWPMAFVGTLMMGTTPWWSVEIFLPFIGILLGNSVNGISMGIDHFTHGIREKREEVLEWLAMGASKNEATIHIFRRSIKIALTPIMNSMVTMGVVSIPGAMTGQILGGSTPMEAAITQMIIVLLISTAVYTGVVTGLGLARKRLFNHRGQPCF